MKKLFFVSTFAVIGSALFWLVANSRANTGTPDYTVVRTDGKFEIRDYPEMRVATTGMKGGEMDSGFGELFRFITGANEGKEKIAMTTPVLIDRTPEKETMSFIMPKEMEAKDVPVPTGEKVRLGKVERSRFVAMRFEGGRSEANEQKAIEALRAWALAGKILVRGEPMFAYYDPPWTPTFLRRNEVLLRIQPDSK